MSIDITQSENNKLKELRIARGLRQKDAMRAVGHKDAKQISYWETGKALPSVPNLFKLAKLYGVLPHEIYPEIWNKPLDDENR